MSRDVEALAGVAGMTLFGQLGTGDTMWHSLLEKGTVAATMAFLVWWMTGRLSQDMRELKAEIQGLRGDLAKGRRQ
jgi:hypothetical protein